MKKLILSLFIANLFISCSSVKSTQQAINAGNYEKAISLSIENLRSDKTKKKNQPYVLMLEEAYEKARKRDQEKILFLKKDANPENNEAIYNLFIKLKNRQNLIKPLLPLRVIAQNRKANFTFENYDKAIIDSKTDVSSYLYANANKLLNSNQKFNFRKAFDDFKYIEKINPNFKNTRALIEEAHNKGTDFVLVTMKNETEQVIPKRLETDLLNFDTYGLNNLWTVYHSKKDANINYDFGLELNLRAIKVSPEQVSEKQIIKEKQIKDGYKYLLDKNGNQVKDSLGNKIKVDHLITVRSEFNQFTQFKSAKVTGQVKYVDLKNDQVTQVFPIDNEFVFQHIYANHKGDKRALEKSFLDLLTVKAVRFPTNETMIYDTGSGLKEKLKYIVTKNNFRN